MIHLHAVNLQACRTFGTSFTLLPYILPNRLIYQWNGTDEIYVKGRRQKMHLFAFTVRANSILFYLWCFCCAQVKFVEHHCRAITSLWHGFSFVCSPAALVRSSIWWSSSYSWATLTHLLFPLRKQAKLFRSWWKQNIAFKASLVKMFVHLAHLNNVASRKGWKNKHWVFMMEQDHYHLCWSNCSNCNGNSKTPQQSRIKLNKTGNNSPGMHPFISFRYWYGAMCQCRNPVLTMHHKSMSIQMCDNLHWFKYKWIKTVTPNVTFTVALTLTFINNG